MTTLQRFVHASNAERERWELWGPSGDGWRAIRRDGGAVDVCKEWPFGAGSDARKEFPELVDTACACAGLAALRINGSDDAEAAATALCILHDFPSDPDDPHPGWLAYEADARAAVNGWIDAILGETP